METIDEPTLRKFLEEICGGEMEILEDLANECAKDAENLIRDIRNAHLSKDPELLKRSAHSLKSTSATFGGHHLSKKAQHLEEIATDQAKIDAHADLVKELIEAIESEGEGFIAELSAVVDLL